MITETQIPAVKLIAPRRFGDDRGWFSETWNQSALANAGIEMAFVQDNHSFSAEQYTVRGLHYQAPPHAQDKLVRCTRGAILDVAVDVRPGSESFGQWVAEELTAENGHQLLVPKGFLHGFATLLPDTEVQYKCTDFYAPEADGGIHIDDPEIGIDWGFDTAKAVLSDKDKVAPFLADWVNPF